MVSKAGDEGAGSAPAEPPDNAPTPAALLEDSTEDLFENAPCGFLSTALDGTIVKVNATLLAWLGHRRADLV
ncbi:PAS domain-containing protein, partial [Streptomyces sp. NPDC052676]|uniref:PAS domain-containing protein n=1 Tax=Streptomyces sp. NPDC052676 TaxID=3154953 RepID=UPI003448B120